MEAMQSRKRHTQQQLHAVKRLHAIYQSEIDHLLRNGHASQRHQPGSDHHQLATPPPAYSPNTSVATNKAVVSLSHATTSALVAPGGLPQCAASGSPCRRPRSPFPVPFDSPFKSQASLCHAPNGSSPAHAASAVSPPSDTPREKLGDVSASASPLQPSFTASPVSVTPPALTPTALPLTTRSPAPGASPRSLGGADTALCSPSAAATIADTPPQPAASRQTTTTSSKEVGSLADWHRRPDAANGHGPAAAAPAPLGGISEVTSLRGCTGALARPAALLLTTTSTSGEAVSLADWRHPPPPLPEGNCHEHAAAVRGRASQATAVSTPQSRHTVAHNAPSPLKTPAAGGAQVKLEQGSMSDWQRKGILDTHGQDSRIQAGAEVTHDAEVSALEAAVSIASDVELDELGALAALCGTSGRFLVHRTVVTLGQGTSLQVDCNVDLAQAGAPPARHNTRQSGAVAHALAQLSLDVASGMFWLDNLGYRSVFINGSKVERFGRGLVPPLSLVQVAGASFVLLVNHAAVDRVRRRTARLTM